MLPIPQKLIANYSICGLAVPRAGNISFMTSSIHDGSRLHLTYTVAQLGFGKRGGGGAQLRIVQEAKGVRLFAAST